LLLALTSRVNSLFPRSVSKSSGREPSNLQERLTSSGPQHATVDYDLLLYYFKLLNIYLTKIPKNTKWNYFYNIAIKMQQGERQSFHPNDSRIML
jgi:hypothetical protein